MPPPPIFWATEHIMFSMCPSVRTCVWACRIRRAFRRISSSRKQWPAILYSNAAVPALEFAIASSVIRVLWTSLQFSSAVGRWLLCRRWSRERCGRHGAAQQRSIHAAFICDLIRVTGRNGSAKNTGLDNDRPDDDRWVSPITSWATSATISPSSSLVPRLSTRHCPHLPRRRCCWAPAPAVHRYLLFAGCSAANPPQAAGDWWDRQTNGRTLYLFC